MRQRKSQSDLNRIVKTNLKYQTKEFFNNSTLHGVRYIAEEGRSFSEKFMWFCFVSIGAVSAFVIIASLWEKFQTNPTITGLDTDFHLHSLEFPSVVLCPTEPYNSEIVEDLAKGALGGYLKGHENNIPMLEILSKLSYDNIDEASDFASKISNQTQRNWNKNGITLRSLAFKIAKKCKLLFSWCRFRNEVKNCCEIFLPLYSERGFCYSFNQRYYGTDVTEEPLGNFSEIHETDKSWALELGLVEKSQFYLHSVTEVFSYDSRVQFTWEPDSSIDVLISMKQTYTTDDAAQLTVAQRKCIFPDQSEVEIHYYKEEDYSLSSCMKECRMENAMKFCHCIPPFYAPANANQNRRKCELNDFKCLSTFAINITNIRKCLKCELSCLTTVYDIEKTSQAQGANADKVRSVNIEFLTWPIIRYKREVLFGWVDLLVSFGGIAGLFLGFSLLSGIEIIYYFTVRASCMMFKNRQHLYEIQTKEDNQAIKAYDLSMELSKFNIIAKRSNVGIVRPVDPLISSSDYKTTNHATQYDSRYNGKRIDESFDVDRDYGKINTKAYNNQAKQNTDIQIPTQRHLSQLKGKFRTISIAPYSQNIKPLDRNYRRSNLNEEESNLVYYGYLP